MAHPSRSSASSRSVRRGAAAVLLAALLTVVACDRITGPSAGGTTYRVGETHAFNVQLGAGQLCAAAARDLRHGVVVRVSRRAVVIEDRDNPPGGYGADEYREIAQRFDDEIWPTVTAHFGVPHDIDGNGRVVLFFTRAVNELTPAGSADYVAGAFASRDLFPAVSTGRLGGCAGSNQAELLYLPVPDATGEVNGSPRPATLELRRAPAAIAHELQHLINASRRLHGPSRPGADWAEASWLNEGLSHVAEELMAREAGAWGGRSNLDLARVIATEQAQRAFAGYAAGNLQLVAQYLAAPESASLLDATALAGRGAAWQFLRYAADRAAAGEATFWSGLVDSGTSGLANLARATGADPLDWLHDWLVSVYTDDAVPGVKARFTQPSWNFRSLMPSLLTPAGEPYGRYPLAVHGLADGAPKSLALAAGSAAYLRFGVAAGGRAEIRTDAGAASCREADVARALAVGEVVLMTGADTGAFCLAGGAEGAEFTLVPFHAAVEGVLALEVVGTGIVPVEAAAGRAPASGARLAARPAAAHRGAHHVHEGWEPRFREQERQELSPLVPGAVRAATSAAATGTGGRAALRIAVVRTR